MNIDLIHGTDMENGYIYFPNRTDEMQVWVLRLVDKNPKEAK